LPRQYLGITSATVVFLMGVLASVVAHGLAASLLACFLSVLAYNLPAASLHLTISDLGNVMTLAFFAVVAILASSLPARMRVQTVTAQARAKTTEGFTNSL
jgi:two-component system sensor histidine kinase KdpD